MSTEYERLSCVLCVTPALDADRTLRSAAARTTMLGCRRWLAPFPDDEQMMLRRELNVVQTIMRDSRFQIYMPVFGFVLFQLLTLDVSLESMYDDTCPKDSSIL
jgi:hypothetical protein